MEFAVILIKQIVIMFILMAIGFYFFKAKVLTEKGSAELGAILLRLVIPVVIINSFWVEKTSEQTKLILESSLVSIVAMTISVGIGAILFGKKDGVACFSTAFSNAGFIGIPLVQAVLGQEAVSYISVMIVIINIFQFTFGIYVITGDKSVMNIKAVLTKPANFAVFVGLFLYFFEIPKPEMVTTLFTTITNLNTPLAMFISGSQLAQTDIVAMLLRKRNWILSIIRLVLVPSVILVAFKFLPIGSIDLKLAIFIAAAGPAGMNGAIFAQQFHKNYTEAVEQVCLSTLLCLITLPIIVTIAKSLF